MPYLSVKKFNPLGAILGLEFFDIIDSQQKLQYSSEKPHNMNYLFCIAAVLRGNHPYLALLNLFWQSEIGRMRWVIVWFPTCEKWSEPRMSLYLRQWTIFCHQIHVYCLPIYFETFFQNILEYVLTTSQLNYSREAEAKGKPQNFQQFCPICLEGLQIS